MKIIDSNLENEFKEALTARESNSGTKWGTYDDLSPNLQQRLERRAERGITATVAVNQLVERFYNPFWSRMSWELPVDRKKLNAFRRHFYQTEPLIGSIIDLHTEFPISPFRVTHPDHEIQEYFNEFIDDLNMFNFLIEMVKEYHVIGEVFPYGFFNDNEKPTEWINFILLNPDFVEVQLLPVARGQYEMLRLEMSDAVKKIVTNGPNHLDTGELYKRLPPDVIAHVRSGNKMVLPAIVASHLKRDGFYFEPHSKSIIDRVMKDLMYRDKMREAQFAVASRHISPTELYLIGEPGDPADQVEIQNFKDILAQTWTDPNRAIVYHHALRAEMIGGGGNILNLGPEFERVEANIFAGLMMSRQFLSGEGPTYAGMSVALDILVARYLALRNKIEHWFKEKVFKPICEIHELWKPRKYAYAEKFKFKNDEGKMTLRKIPWVPDIKWDKANLTDNVAKAQLLQSLKESFGIVSSKTILATIDLDYSSEASQIEEEKGTVMDPEEMASKKLSVTPTTDLSEGGGGASLPGEEAPESEVSEIEPTELEVPETEISEEVSEETEAIPEVSTEHKHMEINVPSRKRPPRSDERRVVFDKNKIRPLHVTSEMNGNSSFVKIKKKGPYFDCLGELEKSNNDSFLIHVYGTHYYVNLREDEFEQC